jgi:hypothetical protein
MTLATLDNSYAGWGAFRTSGATWGVSEDAERLARAFAGIARDAYATVNAHRRFAQPIESLIDLYEQCAKPNWDGEDASPITEATVNDAIAVLFLLPLAVPIPTFHAEASSAIVLEWYKDPKRVLLLVVNGTHTIEYAALLGNGNETHGKVNFAGSFPKAIQNLLDDFSKL